MFSGLRTALRQAGDPLKAAAMRAYMKSEMPYHGVPTPQLRQVFRTVFVDVEFPTSMAWQRQVLDLWRNARFREERYAAMHLAGHKLARPFQTPAAMKVYEELIATGAWWDYVDDIASHRVGPILREFFLRKAIGWALRQYAWTDPAEIRRYVQAHRDRLSNLSRREALKNIEPVAG